MMDREVPRAWTQRNRDGQAAGPWRCGCEPSHPPRTSRTSRSIIWPGARLLGGRPSSPGRLDLRRVPGALGGGSDERPDAEVLHVPLGEPAVVVAELRRGVLAA